jgi:hypothetical protein
VDFSQPTRAAVEMLAWYVQHGGDVEGKDNDGMSVKMLVDMMKKRVPELDAVVKKGRGERKEGVCENCGREGRKGFKVCARCKGVRYCGEVCQRVDWKGHKKLGDAQSANIALTKGMHDHTTKKKNHSINNKLQ